jgi:hypothetical protein
MYVYLSIYLFIYISIYLSIRSSKILTVSPGRGGICSLLIATTAARP